MTESSSRDLLYGSHLGISLALGIMYFLFLFFPGNTHFLLAIVYVNLGLLFIFVAASTALGCSILLWRSWLREWAIPGLCGLLILPLIIAIWSVKAFETRREEWEQLIGVFFIPYMICSIVFSLHWFLLGRKRKQSTQTSVPMTKPRS